MAAISLVHQPRSTDALPRRRQPVDSPFDGPLGSFLDALVRFEGGLARMLAPLGRRDRSSR